MKPRGRILHQPVVLLVEDEALFRTMEVEVLREAGFWVLEAQDADEAFECLKARDEPARPAAALIDGATRQREPTSVSRGAVMDPFDHLLNWTLKRGSHTFPGPDSGTCINEAALVAAGFEYRPIRDVWQMPACFARPICELAAP